MRYFFNYVCQMNSIKQFVILSAILVLVSSFIKAQSTYLPINSFTNYHIDRLEITGSLDFTSTSLKPYSRAESDSIKDYIFIFHNEKNSMNSAKYIRADNFEYHANESWVYGTSNSWLSFKKRIYTRPSALYHYKNQDLTFMIENIQFIDNQRSYYYVLLSILFGFINYYNLKISSFLPPILLLNLSLILLPYLNSLIKNKLVVTEEKVYNSNL